jgi:hypothetical protein
LFREHRPDEVGVVVRLRLPRPAARVLGALEVEARSAVVLAGLRATGLLPEEREEPPRQERGE